MPKDQGSGGSECSEVRSSCSSSLTDDTSSNDILDDSRSMGQDVLAALASLGISDTVRMSVQQALDQLSTATASARLAEAQGQCVESAAPGSATGPQLPLSVTERKRLEELEKKFAMSRSIMRKLYHRNVELEKEVQMLKANTGTTPITFSVSTSDLLAKRARAAASTQGSSVQASGPDTLDTLVVQALQERDATVHQLQQALDAARRRCALLDSQLLTSSSQTSGGRPAAAAAAPQQLREVLAQSQMHYSKYKQIREDYNRLLNKRAGTLASSKAASSIARGMVSEMRERLQQELSEREAEAALYSARLYESERQMSDWYVERRLLEEHVAQLNAEIAQRDRLDAEMEVCMCGLFERLKLLEQTNEKLRAQLSGQAG